MHPRFYLLFLCLIVFALIRASFGQDCVVTTTVRFLEGQKQPISNIAADELKAEVGGSPANVIAVSPGAKPQIILLIDASSSIKGTWSQVIAAAKQFVANADNGVKAVVFRDRIIASADGRSDAEKLLDQLSALTPKEGGTALYETLVTVGQQSRRS